VAAPQIETPLTPSKMMHLVLLRWRGPRVARKGSTMTSDDSSFTRHQPMRLPPPSRADLPDEVANLVALATPAGGEPPPTISVLAHQPALLGPFLTWAAALALQGVLPRRDHEILALRTARLHRSTFERDEHVRFAHEAGLTDGEGSTRSGDRRPRVASPAPAAS